MRRLPVPEIQPEIPLLAVVVPCYNEEEALPETAAVLIQILDKLLAEAKIAPGSHLLLVDDGSADATWQVIDKLVTDIPGIEGLKLSRNFGHQNAVLAGMTYAAETANAVITIDADLQDDPHAIVQMVACLQQGAQIVYGVRDDRTSDTRFKRGTAQGFYKLLKMMGVKSIYNHADYRLLSRNALQALLSFKERNLFLRGIVPLVGFQTDTVYYKRTPRFAGESKFNFLKMLAFSWTGITSLTIKPLHFVTLSGIVVFFISIVLMVYAGVAWLLDETVAGWASTVIPLYFIGGIQLLCIGLVGEYVGKIYVEVKDRPAFIVETYKPGKNNLEGL